MNVRQLTKDSTGGLLIVYVEDGGSTCVACTLAVEYQPRNVAIIGQGCDIVSLYMCITQYGSTAYIGMAMGCPALYNT